MAKVTQGKVMAVGLGTVCVGIIGIVGVYLPFYSQMSQDGADARRELHIRKFKERLDKQRELGGQGPLDEGQMPEIGSQPAGLVAGSMWKNVANARDSK
mmetsp:Transcript_16219/g.25411  ORF Transcript_16219/g.25411 Transcript_16219/m.25411 type:complete len:99 (-) Transcript_16219:631-927(-)